MELLPLRDYMSVKWYSIIAFIRKEKCTMRVLDQAVKWYLQFLGKAGLITVQLTPVLLEKADSCGTRTAAVLCFFFT